MIGTKYLNGFKQGCAASSLDPSPVLNCSFGTTTSPLQLLIGCISSHQTIMSQCLASKG